MSDQQHTTSLKESRPSQRPGGFYFVKTPWWMRRWYGAYEWKVPTREKILYLTFDDGPHPVATPFVLDALQQYKAKATFFCIGKNVQSYPSLFKRISDEGHRVGNHTQHHLNGWKTPVSEYLADTAMAASLIPGNLFRPPYGRIKKVQAKALKDYRIIMWDVLSGDFDTRLSGEKCAHHVIWNARPGSIIVFHDSEKAFHRLVYALPAVLAYFSMQGYTFQHL